MLSFLPRPPPFFAVIATGFLAGRARFLTPEATGQLTRFVFYFALSAMLFGFAANLSLTEIFNLPFVLAYLLGTGVVWAVVLAVAVLRGETREAALFEAHAGVIGNVGFLGIPMLVLLLGPQAVGPVLLVLAVDLVVFSSLLTLLITLFRSGRVGADTLRLLAVGLVKNPMIVSTVLGLAWGATGRSLWPPVQDFMTLLGAAATPCALFAIGASLAGRRPDRPMIAAWLGVAKLILHPAAVALCALVIFPVPRGGAEVMIAAAALPVAGNVFILAQHYGVAPQRISTAILISTALSVLTVTAVIALLEMT